MYDTNPDKYPSKAGRDCLAAKGDMVGCSYPQCTCGPKPIVTMKDRLEQSGAVSAQPRRLLSTLSSAERKQYPMASGLLDYFPDALALVAHVSYLGNEKHNKGQPLHWARGKSNDHDDCMVRHLVERGTLDPDGADQLAQTAWRALASLQEYLEKKHKLDLPRGATAPGVELAPK